MFRYMLQPKPRICQLAYQHYPLLHHHYRAVMCFCVWALDVVHCSWQQISTPRCCAASVQAYKSNHRQAVSLSNSQNCVLMYKPGYEAGCAHSSFQPCDPAGDAADQAAHDGVCSREHLHVYHLQQRRLQVCLHHHGHLHVHAFIMASVYSTCVFPAYKQSCGRFCKNS